MKPEWIVVVTFLPLLTILVAGVYGRELPMDRPIPTVEEHHPSDAERIIYILDGLSPDHQEVVIRAVLYWLEAQTDQSTLGTRYARAIQALEGN